MGTELRAVGKKDITEAEAYARALDVNNRQFLDPITNRRTKYLGDDTHVSVARSEVSVTQNPNALIDRRFGEVTEMKDIFNQAVAKIKDPYKLSPVELKNKINRNIRDIIKTGESDSAVKVRDALHDLGFENVKGKGWTMKEFAGARTAQRSVPRFDR